MGDSFAVEAIHVSTAYPRSNDVALRDIYLRVPHGAIVLISGPNGAGKTTLLELILGFLRPLRGELYVLGLRMPENARYVRRRCGYVMQNFMKPPDTPYTAREVILMGLAPYKPPFFRLSRRDENLLRDLAEFLGVSGILDRPFGTLSGGQQQRIMLARALIRRPSILLLDEPFSSIDRGSRHEFSELIHSIREEWGTTILVVSHDVEPIERYADIFVEMREGRVVEEKWSS